MANKITQEMRYNALIDLIEKYGIEISAGEGADKVTEGKTEVVDWLLDRIEKLKKKSSGVNAKKNDEHEEIISQIMEVLAMGKMTAGELTKNVNDKYETNYSSNKIISMLNKLTPKNGTGEVLREVEKKVPYFSLAPIENGEG